VSAPLFPTWPMPQTQTQIATTRPPVAYPPSPAFDFNKGDFVLDGAGRLIVLDGYAAWGQWCVKAALTERATYPLYTPAYGANLAAIGQAPDHLHAESVAQAEISGALLADPRTQSVDQFAFVWNGDQVLVSFVVTPTVGTSLPITVQLSYP
jgi:hypothetical protein